MAGAARSGTTALIESLRLHPDVFVTRPKEPHYFAFHGQVPAFRGPGDEEWVNRVAVTDPDAYLGLFAEAGGHAARGEGSVTTLYYAERAVEEIRRVNPDMKIVVLLREPVDRAFSSYVYLRLRGVEDAPDFRTGLARESERMAAGWQHMWHYRAVSRYADDLRTLREGLGEDQVRVWFYDDLQADFAGVQSEVVDFLCLPPLPPGAPALPRVNASGRARSETVQRGVRWATRHQGVRSVVKRIIPFGRREQLRSALLRRDTVAPDLAAELEPEFRDDLIEVARMVAGRRPAWLPREARP